MKTVVVLVLGLGWGLAAPAAAGPGEDPHALVAQGKRLFAAGRYAAAQEKFAAAEVLAPENLAIAYDRALAYQAAGDAAKAEDYYRKAAVSADLELAARTRFNLGALEAARARAKLGKDPLQVPAGAREEILGHLDRAVQHFRGVLETKPGDRDARYNLEVIRLFVKDLQDRWRKADREKARKEANLLRYLEVLMQEQKGLQRATETQLEGPENAKGSVRLEQIRIVQGELVEEMPHLRDKVKEHLGKLAKAPAAPGAPPRAAPDPRKREALKEAEKKLLELVDGAEGGMKDAMKALDALDLAAARTAQGTAHDRLLAMWKGLADFAALLGRAIREEEALVAATEPRAADHAGTEKEEEAAAAAERLRADQEIARDLVPLMASRARAMVKRLESMPAGPPPAAGGGKPPGGRPKPAELKRAFEKALALLPRAGEAMAAASAALGDRAWPRGLEEEKKAAEVLHEIDKLFPKPRRPRQNERNKKNEKKKDGQPNDRQKKAGPNKDRKKEAERRRKLRREEAERLLQKMRESRKKREARRRTARIGRRIHVDKDW